MIRFTFRKLILMSYEGTTRMGTVKSESCEFWLKLIRACKNVRTVGIRMM